MDLRKLLPPKDAAERLGLQKRTLEHWRWKGKGPDYTRVGGRIMYDPADLDAWLEANKVRLQAA